LWWWGVVVVNGIGDGGQCCGSDGIVTIALWRGSWLLLLGAVMAVITIVWGSGEGHGGGWCCIGGCSVVISGVVWLLSTALVMVVWFVVVVVVSVVLDLVVVSSSSCWVVCRCMCAHRKPETLPSKVMK